MQELNREANTLGSKSAHIDTAGAEINLKFLTEQMRETAAEPEVRFDGGKVYPKLILCPMIRRVERLEPRGTSRWWLHNLPRSLKTVPLLVYARP